MTKNVGGGCLLQDCRRPDLIEHGYNMFSDPVLYWFHEGSGRVTRFCPMLYLMGKDTWAGIENWKSREVTAKTPAGAD